MDRSRSLTFAAVLACGTPAVAQTTETPRAEQAAVRDSESMRLALRVDEGARWQYRVQHTVQSPTLATGPDGTVPAGGASPVAGVLHFDVRAIGSGGEDSTLLELTVTEPDAGALPPSGATPPARTGATPTAGVSGATAAAAGRSVTFRVELSAFGEVRSIERTGSPGADTRRAVDVIRHDLECIFGAGLHATELRTGELYVLGDVAPAAEARRASDAATPRPSDEALGFATLLLRFEGQRTAATGPVAGFSVLDAEASIDAGGLPEPTEPSDEASGAVAPDAGTGSATFSTRDGMLERLDFRARPGTGIEPVAGAGVTIERLR